MIKQEDAIRRHKAMLRRNILAELARLTPERRAMAATRARDRLESQAEWVQAQSVLLFAPTAQELDVWPLVSRALAAGKQVALPRFVSQTGTYIACCIEDPEADLVTGKFGIREPAERCLIVPLLRLDFCLVPGVAFDLQGHRLGRGRGFYDQLLRAVRGTTCGVGFEEQIVREVPVEQHDMVLDRLLTPTRWMETKEV